MASQLAAKILGAMSNTMNMTKAVQTYKGYSDVAKSGRVGYDPDVLQKGHVSKKPQYKHPDMNIQIFNVENGTLIEITRYDEETNNRISRSWVVPNSDDLIENLGLFITQFQVML